MKIYVTKDLPLETVFDIKPRFLRHAEFCHAHNSFSFSAIVPDNDCVKKNPNKKKPLLAMT